MSIKSMASFMALCDFLSGGEKNILSVMESLDLSPISSSSNDAMEAYNVVEEDKSLEMEGFCQLDERLPDHSPERSEYADETVSCSSSGSSEYIAEISKSNGDRVEARTIDRCCRGLDGAAKASHSSVATVEKIVRARVAMYVISKLMGY